MSKGNILIVEDSYIVAYHLQATLEGDGYTVLNKCDKGEDAIQFVQHTRPDIVLMDIMLRGEMDGVQAAAILKDKFNLPVIYITALTDKGTINKAKFTEPYGYLTKPFEDREIFTVIEMALYKHDITSKLKQSEYKYLSTVNSISDAIVTIDHDFQVTFMNPTAIALTQIALQDAIGKPLMEVLNLRHGLTQEVGINPIQCPIGGKNQNQMIDGLILLGRQGLEAPIGESSIAPLLDGKEEFIGLILVFKDITEKRIHEQLKQEMDRQRIMAQIEGQEKERARVAKDLHDGLGQMLNAIKMNIKMIVKNNDEASNLSSLMDEAIQESVRISENLWPAKLKDFDLAKCLRSLCQGIEQSSQISIVFEANGYDEDIDISPKVNFYRIAQEALTNAVKHGQPDSIHVQLNVSNEVLRMTIEDNGIGTKPVVMNNTLSQNGLINMRDRAEVMGGKFTFESDTVRGTMVIVEVPVSKLKIREEV